MDVRRLKGDLWRKIHTEFQSDKAAAIDVDDDEENVAVEGGSKAEEVRSYPTLHA